MVAMCVAGLVLLVTVGYLGLKGYSPEYVASLSRYSADKKLDAAFALDLKSMNTKAEKGLFGRPSMDVPLYYANGQPIPDGIVGPDGKMGYMVIKRGVLLYAPDYIGKKATVRNEGFVHVDIPDGNGIFLNSNDAYIPTRFWVEEKDS